MLIKCPECDLQVSDQALFCPHCGYPMKKNAEKQTYKKSNKRKRLPNGFGQISEIKNRNLRKPFRAMISVGKDPKGRPIVKPLKPVSYFETYNEAYTALLEYNKNPYDLKSVMTMDELFQEWSKKHFESIGSGAIAQIERAWKFSHSIHNIRLQDLRIIDMKNCIENASLVVDDKIETPNYLIKRRMKANFNLLYDYALDNEYVDVNKARNFSLDESVPDKGNNGHIAFTDEEMQKLWDNLYTVDGVDIILIQCYSGWRPQELANIKLTDVDLKEGFMRGGMKTAAGKKRMVPIHSKIRPLIEKQYKYSKSIGNEYLITCNLDRKKNVPLEYQRYKVVFKRVVFELDLNPEHKTHDGRVQFVTMAKKYKVDEYAIKYMVGHNINDLTEGTYTKREPEWFKEEIEKIK